MTIAHEAQPRTSPTSVPKFQTAAEWLDSLGNVPAERIVFDPLPGTATEEDVLRLDDHEDRRCELVDGTLVEKTMGWEEGIVAINIALAVGNFVRARKLGLCGGSSTMMRLLPTKIRLPDFSYFSHDTLALRDKHKRVPSLRPDLAVEVLSDSNTPKEMSIKLAEYFEAGTRLVWYVDPRTKTVDVYTSPTSVTKLSDVDVITGGDVLPGFEANISEFFEGTDALQ